MNEHLETQLDAYLDGEMSALQRSRVENHLALCSDCRRMLAERQALSALLQQVPAPAGLTSETLFMAELKSQLKPRRDWARLQQMSWILIPFGLLVMLSFVLTVVLMSSLVGFFPGVTQLLASLAAVQNGTASSQALGAFIGLAPGHSLLEGSWISALLVLGAICLIYVSWLASWWTRNQQAAE